MYGNQSLEEQLRFHREQAELLQRQLESQNFTPQSSFSSNYQAIPALPTVHSVQNTQLNSNPTHGNVVFNSISKLRELQVLCSDNTKYYKVCEDFALLCNTGKPFAPAYLYDVGCLLLTIAFTFVQWEHNLVSAWLQNIISACDNYRPYVTADFMLIVDLVRRIVRMKKNNTRNSINDFLPPEIRIQLISALKNLKSHSGFYSDPAFFQVGPPKILGLFNLPYNYSPTSVPSMHSNTIRPSASATNLNKPPINSAKPATIPPKPIDRLQQDRFPFFVGNLIPPFILNNQSVSAELHFTVQPNIIDRNWNLSNFRLGIKLRSYRMGDAGQKHEWPQNLLQIYLGNEEISFSKKTFITTSENLMRPEGIHLPVELITKVQPNINVIRLNFGTKPEKQVYVFVLELCAYMTISDCRQLVQSTEKFSRQEFLKIVDRLLNGADDDLCIVSDSFQISVRCPLTLRRIQIPVRSRACSHALCFDLEPWLVSYNQQTIPHINYSCPICGRYIEISSICIDEYVEDVLKSIQNDKDLTEVSIMKDGSWKK